MGGALPGCTWVGGLGPGVLRRNVINPRKSKKTRQNDITAAQPTRPMWKTPVIPLNCDLALFSHQFPIFIRNYYIFGRQICTNNALSSKYSRFPTNYQHMHYFPSKILNIFMRLHHCCSKLLHIFMNSYIFGRQICSHNAFSSKYSTFPINHQHLYYFSSTILNICMRLHHFCSELLNIFMNSSIFGRQICRNTAFSSKYSRFPINYQHLHHFRFKILNTFMSLHHFSGRFP